MSAIASRLLSYALNWLLKQAINLAAFLIKQKIRHAEADKALKEYKEAGTKPGLTPEQIAKEQEDAFEKLADTVNKRP